MIVCTAKKKVNNSKYMSILAPTCIIYASLRGSTQLHQFSVMSTTTVWWLFILCF